MAVIESQSVADVCAAARAASRELAQSDSATKDRALHAIAAALRERAPEILAANERDMQAGRENEIGAALLDRLRLDAPRLEAIAQAVEQVAALSDPVGELIDGHRLANGLDVRRVRVPLGVVAVVYEARPNVTIDAAVLCLKSGNACVLRGSSSAAHSNRALGRIAAEAAYAAGLAPGSLGVISGGARDELAELATQRGTVDLIIPRGGEGLKRALEEVATVPVIYAASGNCHVYVDAGADLEMATAIAMNAKTQRPGVCNAAETLLVHRAVAGALLPELARQMGEAGVLIRADDQALDAVGGERPGIERADEADWATEYLALTLAVRVVDSLEEAIDHIATYGSGHSEAIVTQDTGAARSFTRAVDAACVYVNASTRFTDGGEFGMGAEIGNSTQKLHVRGPIGLRELCTFKYVVEGDGQIRG